MKHDSEKKLIESIYNVAVDPQYYQKFIERWGDEFLNFPSGITEQDNGALLKRSAAISIAMEDHFLRANDILKMVDHGQDINVNLKQEIEADALPTFLVTKNQQVAFLNQAVTDILDIQNQADLSAIPITAENTAELNLLFNEFETLTTHKILTIIQVMNQTDGEPIIFTVSKLVDATTNIGYIKFRAVYAVWSDRVGQLIQDTFGLTNGELDVAHQLVDGKKLAEIAEDKNRSIFTIRTQSKSLFKKTRLTNQSELIKLFTVLQNFDYQETNHQTNIIEHKSNEQLVTKSHHILHRQNGRKLYYDVYGHRAGRPVLFLHGLVTGTNFTDENIEYLHQHKIKLIAPHRAGFGHSDGYFADDRLVQFAADIKAVLNAENVKKCDLLGHSMGSYYAYYLGANVPEKFNKITIVSGAVPFTSMAHINKLHKRQRILTYTGKYTPKLLPFILRGSAMQVKKYGAEDLIDALYKDSPLDYKLLSDPMYRQILARGFEAAFNQGIDTILADGICLHGDEWDNLVSACKTPITIFHGQENQAVPIQQVQDFIGKHKHLTLKPINCGQLLFYSYIEAVFENN